MDYLKKIHQIPQMSVNDILVGCAICFVFGVFFKRFIDNKSKQYSNFSLDTTDDSAKRNEGDTNLKDQNEDLEDQDIKMLFICKVEGKSGSTMLASKVAHASVGKCLLLYIKSCTS